MLNCNFDVSGRPESIGEIFGPVVGLAELNRFFGFNFLLMVSVKLALELSSDEDDMDTGSSVSGSVNEDGGVGLVSRGLLSIELAGVGTF